MSELWSMDNHKRTVVIAHCLRL
uniref:Uncharacterized protein n=1 Tax=Anguilla anguilla TaxID=7936 RepID=A0A0E9SUD7_ANGAN